ncbi:uncharacterized protein G2W53_022291 [Senna tora]|uniref:Uncharacterized protein n=1 Tax=Senna tora TaxID=362788 RepID=A0A834TMF5_9FABA|nr:uncharacterized protein G2W53_022291 [Senna tora]
MVWWFSRWTVEAAAVFDWIWRECERRCENGEIGRRMMRNSDVIGNQWWRTVCARHRRWSAGDGRTWLTVARAWPWG